MKLESSPTGAGKSINRLLCMVSKACVPQRSLKCKFLKKEDSTPNGNSCQLYSVNFWSLPNHIVSTVDLCFLL